MNVPHLLNRTVNDCHKPSLAGVITVHKIDRPMHKILRECNVIIHYNRNNAIQTRWL